MSRTLVALALAVALAGAALLSPLLGPAEGPSGPTPRVAAGASPADPHMPREPIEVQLAQPARESAPAVEIGGSGRLGGAGRPIPPTPAARSGADDLAEHHVALEDGLVEEPRLRPLSPAEIEERFTTLCAELGIERGSEEARELHGDLLANPWTYDLDPSLPLPGGAEATVDEPLADPPGEDPIEGSRAGSDPPERGRGADVGSSGRMVLEQ